MDLALISLKKEIISLFFKFLFILFQKWFGGLDWGCNSYAMMKQGCIHDSISRVRWAGAVMEVRSPFSKKK